jgi:O-acetylhomoserine (thiol)-lyase
LGRLGVEARFVDGDDPEAFAARVDDRTRFLYTEIIGNPSGSVADLEALGEVAAAHQLPLVVDSTFATPYLCRPFEHGADIVVHSATKFIGGHGTSIGGVVVESGRFDWGSGRFDQMTEPAPGYNDLRFWENFGEYAFCTKLRAEQLRDVALPSPRSTPSSFSRVWRPCPRGWTSMWLTPRRWPSFSTPTRR